MGVADGCGVRDGDGEALRVGVGVDDGAGVGVGLAVGLATVSVLVMARVSLLGQVKVSPTRERCQFALVFVCLCTWFESHEQNTERDHRDYQIYAKA